MTAEPDHRIFVVAPSRQRFAAWCQDQGWHERHPLLRYVHSVHQLRGYRGVDVRLLDYPRSAEASHLEWNALIDLARMQP